jgi:hypothetical protein
MASSPLVRNQHRCHRATGVGAGVARESGSVRAKGHPAHRGTSRSTTSNADDRFSAVVNSLVIVCSKLSCSSLSWRFCSALRDRSAFLKSLLIIVGCVGFRTIDGTSSNFPQPASVRILDFRPMDHKPKAIGGFSRWLTSPSFAKPISRSENRDDWCRY